MFPNLTKTACHIAIFLYHQYSCLSVELRSLGRFESLLPGSKSKALFRARLLRFLVRFARNK
jgi:hypothetical protein